jgi:ABC-2 type transport system permease protein
MQHTQRISPTTWDYWRIVLALAAKDIVDALKNKTTLTIVLGLSLMMLTVEALPLLLKLDDRPRVAIYDAARTGVADELRREGAVQISELRSAEAALNAARESSGALVAVTLPPGWESTTGALTVDGYVAHWVSAKTTHAVVTQAEAALTAVANRPITIQPQTVYPTPANGGHTIMVALGLVLATTMITSILVPYLILEEKTSHTLDALRVSPASVNQVLLGKGLAGVVYGVLAAAVLLAFNLPMVNQWGLLLLAVLALALFGVGLGLLVGVQVENEGAVQMWVGLLVIVLMFPLMLVFANSSRLPAWVQPVMAWLPTTAAFDLLRLSFGNTWPAAQIWPKAVVLLLAVVLVFAAAGWRLRAWEAR